MFGKNSFPEYNFNPIPRVLPDPGEKKYNKKSTGHRRLGLLSCALRVSSNGYFTGIISIITVLL
jgi:hypothetical protein